MKKNLNHILFLGYCIPYGFLSMYGDYKYGSMLFYILMIVCLSLLFLFFYKTNNKKMIIIGNILSFVSSFLFLNIILTEPLGWYFKPFTAKGLLLFLTLIIFIIQIVILYCLKGKHKNKNNI